MSSEGDLPWNDPDSIRQRMLRRLAQAVVRVVLLAVIAFTAYRLTVANMIRAELARIHNAGYPTEAADLLPDPRKPASSQSQQYQRGMDALVIDPAQELMLPLFNNTTLPKPGVVIDADTAGRIEKFLYENAAAMDHFKQASIRSAGSGMDWGEHLAAHLGHLRRASKLLELEIALACYEADSQRAMESMRTMIRLGQVVDNEPVVMARVYQAAVYTHAAGALNRMLFHFNLSRAQLEELQDLVRRMDNPQGLARALAGQRCEGIMLFDEPVELGHPLASRPIELVQLRLLKWTGLYDLDRLTYLRLMERYVDAAERRALLDFNEIELRASLPGYCMVTRSIAPNLKSVLVGEMQTQAILELTALSLALKLYQRDRGSMPERLEDLVPEKVRRIPQDPFTRQAMIYHRIPEGALIYSTGQDKQDNGGVELDEEMLRFRRGTDIVFFVPK